MVDSGQSGRKIIAAAEDTTGLFAVRDRRHELNRKVQGKMKKVLLVPVFLLATAALAAGTPDITGQWAVHNSIAGHESDQKCTFTQADGKITGTCQSDTDEKPAEVTGTVDGNKAAWKLDVDFNGTPITLNYTATLDDSGKIAGEVEVDPFGVTGDFTATPVTDAAKPAAQ